MIGVESKSSSKVIYHQAAIHIQNLFTDLVYPLAMVVFLGDAGSGKITLY